MEEVMIEEEKGSPLEEVKEAKGDEEFMGME